MRVRQLISSWLRGGPAATPPPPLTKPRQALLARMPRHSVCAEIGVYKGNFSQHILNIVGPARLHLIDPWRYEADAIYARSLYGQQRGLSQAHMDSVHEAVRQRFASQIASGIVQIHRAASLQASADFTDEYFDWVYVDGNHRYAFVKQDLEAYFPKLKPGGYLAGDDYGEKGWWQDGVTQAVDEFLARGLCDQIIIDGSQFSFRRK